ncbi:MAG: hypothetical protein KatS3mg066_4090 [Fischerella sp.]|nr:MAG: hypothetical protein KatS3mg066_4090 [Fischerella sp.]
MRRQRTVSIPVTVTQKLTWKEDNAKTVEAEMLLQRLRSLRKQLADEQSVPPYLIFADSTLKLMAQVKPQTKDAFSRLSGVGSHKLNQYGDKFLAEIRAYCQEHNAQEPKLNPTSSLTSVSATALQTLLLYQQGLSVSEIAEKRNLRPTTIFSHLCDLIEKNQPIDINHLVPLEKQQKILQVLEIIGDISLTPIKEYLGDSYSFEEIRLVRSQWRKKSHKS